MVYCGQCKLRVYLTREKVWKRLVVSTEQGRHFEYYLKCEDCGHLTVLTESQLTGDLKLSARVLAQAEC